eukprot:3409291-Rhodomonas_salina.1
MKALYCTRKQNVCDIEAMLHGMDSRAEYSAWKVVVSVNTALAEATAVRQSPCALGYTWLPRAS